MAHDDFPNECWSRTPRYSAGGKLTAEQLNASQADAVKRDRLVNVAMHGVGIAHGFEIKTDKSTGHVVIEDRCITIGCGLAFDKYGRMLFWRGGRLKINDVVGCKPDHKGKYTLHIHYAEKSDKGGAFDPCHEGTDWVDRCIAFTLTPKCERWDCCAPDVPCEDCMTRKEWVCTRNGFYQGVVPKDDQLDHACEDPPALASSDCGRVSYDPEAGLPIACIAICDLNAPTDDGESKDSDKTDEKDKAEGGPGYGKPEQHPHDCDPDYGFCPCHAVESCSIRPVAYRNPLLYELINQDDVRLSKIDRYSWSDWKMEEWSDKCRVPFSKFKARAMACKEGRDPQHGFMVMFTCPVQRKTLHPLSVLMEIYIRENRPHYWLPHRVPIDVRHLDQQGQIIADDCEEDCVWGLLICPLDDWIEYELEDKNSTILDCANRGQLARVEITLRGSEIRDCCGLMIDVCPPDINENDPCGNRAGQSMPGGLFTTVFRVGPNDDT